MRGGRGLTVQGLAGHGEEAWGRLKASDGEDCGGRRAAVCRTDCWEIEKKMGTPVRKPALDDRNQTRGGSG